MAEIKTRLKLKYDSYEQWIEHDPVLLAGEVAFATVSVKQDGKVNEVPSVLMKVGDGVKKYSELDFTYAKAADVIAAAKSEESMTAFVNNVIANAGIATSEAMQKLAERVTTAEGDIDKLEGLVGTTAVATQISNAISALNIGDYAKKTEVEAVQTELDAYQTSNDAAVLANTNAIAAEEARAKVAEKANADAIALIKDGQTIDSFADVETALAGKETAGAAAQALIDAKAYTDGLAGNYEVAGAAATAEANAKKYTDEEIVEWVGTKTVQTQISEAITGLDLANTYDAKGDAAQALVDAKAYADAEDAKIESRVADLEATEHTHSFVESELNKIAEGDVAKWNAAEQNAKTYADGLNTAMDSRVDALEAKFTGDDSVADQIAAAVEAEKTDREAADADLQEQITANDGEIADLKGLVGTTSVATQISTAVKAEADRAKEIEADLEERLAAVEGDYLVEADKTELAEDIATAQAAAEAAQADIDAFMEAAEVGEAAVDTLKEIQAYITSDGAAADKMTKDIAANAKAIADEQARAEEVEGGLQDAIDAIEADYLKAADKTELAKATTDALAEAKSYTDAEVKELADGQVATNKTDIATLKEQMGGSSVQAQINSAITGLNIDQYATDTELTAATDRITTVEGKVTTLEGEMDTAQADIEALETEVAKKANSADLATVATTGNIADLVQTAGTYIVFDCGSASVNV